jgi:hypothetical protein
LSTVFTLGKRFSHSEYRLRNSASFEFGARGFHVELLHGAAGSELRRLGIELSRLFRRPLALRDRQAVGHLDRGGDTLAACDGRKICASQSLPTARRAARSPGRRGLGDALLHRIRGGWNWVAIVLGFLVLALSLIGLFVVDTRYSTP